MWARATFTTLESIAPITAPASTEPLTSHLFGRIDSARARVPDEMVASIDIQLSRWGPAPPCPVSIHSCTPAVSPVASNEPLGRFRRYRAAPRTGVQAVGRQSLGLRRS